MNRSELLIFLLAICLLFSTVFADVAPDPGYVRQPASLIVETADDLSDYRFFIESPVRLEEIKINKGEPTLISAAGHAGAARIGTLWAIPRTSIREFGIDTPETLAGLRDALGAGNIDRAIKLLSHDFQETIRESERASWKDPVYRLDENADQGITAVFISGGQQGNNKIGNKGPVLYSTEPKTPAFWLAVAGGAILTSLFIIFGARALRHSKSKAAGNHL